MSVLSQVGQIQKELGELERAVAQDGAVGREKLASQRSSREMYEGQVRCVQAEIDELNHQIQIREARTEKMKIKHEATSNNIGRCCSFWKDNSWLQTF